MLSPEYVNSRERLEKIEELVVDGRDAEKLIKYADLLRKEYEQELLDVALNKGNIDTVLIEYRVACRFAEMLKHAAMVGKQKEETYNSLRKNIY